MHPDKFLGRQSAPEIPALSDAEKVERLNGLSATIAKKRKEAVEARKESGIEDVWMSCEEAYCGIDDANRHEFGNAKWAKPTSMEGPVTTNYVRTDPLKSSAYVRLTTRYVDYASAKIAEILLPIDDKAFSISATPVPSLLKSKEDLTPIIDAATGQPITHVPEAPPQPPGQPQPPEQPQPITAADVANAEIAKAAEKAEKAEKRIYDWMTESKYPREMRKVVKDAARIGCGILKGPFPDIKISKGVSKDKSSIALEIKKEVVPVVRWVDPWNAFPAEGCGEDIHDGDYFIERDYLSTRNIQKLKDDDTYLSDQIDKVLKEGPGKVYIETRESEKVIKNRYEVWYYYGTLTKEDLMIAIGDPSLISDIDGDDIPVIVTLINDTIVRAVVNPMDSGSFPYHVISWSRRPGHWAGVGVGEKIDMPQRTCNAATRSILNSAGLSAGVQIIIDQLGVVPADGNWSLTPNKIWYKTAESTAVDVRAAFFAVQMPSAYNDLMGVIQYAMKLAEESSGIPLVTQGQSGDTSPQTFGQAELQNNNAHTWLRGIGYLFDDMITEPVVKSFYEWLLLDPSIPDDEKGDFQIDAHGSMAMVERAIQEQVMGMILQASANPAFGINPEKAFSEMLKTKRIDPRKIQYSEDEKAKLPQQQPPIQIAVEQLKGQNALQLQQAEGQAELQLIQQEAAQTKQDLMNGGTTPHMAMATARIEQERIRAESSQVIQASRSQAELARAQKEFDIAQQNGAYRIEELRLQKEIAILQYSTQERISLDAAKIQLAKSAMDNRTKKELSAAEIELSRSENANDRAHDMIKHATKTPSLVRDELSTGNTP